MNDTVTIWLSDEEKTVESGASLARTLYVSGTDILLSGALGAGKTTFLRGLAQGLGIEGRITSPTFALEQRYRICVSHGLPQGSAFLHIDLYRLHERRAEELLSGTDTQSGIRAIEWPESVSVHRWRGPTVRISLREQASSDGDATGRTLAISFEDTPLPTRDDILAWRTEVKLPSHIAEHCDTVAAVALRFAHVLLQRGIIVRPLLLERASEAHDLLRFIDFRNGAGPKGSDPTDPVTHRLWEEWKSSYSGLHHEAACAAFLRERGFPALAEVVSVHGLTLPSPARSTTEQQLLFYADKRVNVATLVSLDERFSDFQRRYGRGEESEKARLWYAEAKHAEKELFPEGVPF